MINRQAVILTGHTPEARFKQYRKERKDIWDSNKIIIDNIPPGNGGTTHWNEIMVNDNLSNISLVNNHYLQYENITAINNGKIKAPEDLEIIDLYGKLFLIPEYMQQELALPECFCDLYKSNPFLFKLKQKGYSPPDWCKDLCPHKDNCNHKYLFNTAFETAKCTVYGSHDPVLWIPPKAYNSSITPSKGDDKEVNLINTIMTKYQNSNLFYDENLFNYIYTQENITDWQLRIFKDFISRKIIKLDNNLYDLWKDLIPLIDSLYNNLILSISDTLKIKDLKEKVKTFSESYSSKDFQKWHGRVMFLMFKHKISIKISNPLNNLHKIIADMYKNRNTSERANFMFGKSNDGEAHNFTYFIDQSDVIRENIKKSGKFILRSGFQHIEKFWNCIFPEIDDYAIIGSTDNNIYLKDYWRYTRGAFPKYMLYQKDFRPKFYDLAEFCKKIVDFPIIRKQKILIIVFQKAVKRLQMNYFPPDKYPNISFEYWYNLEGKNTYIDCTGVILFGSAGTPEQVDLILSNMYNIPIRYIYNRTRNAEMSQGMLRIRPNMFPNTKWCIGLTKIIPNRVTNYINFNRAEDIILIPYLHEKNSTVEEIRKDIYLNEIGIRSLQIKLTSLCESNILKRNERKNRNLPYTYSPF